MRANSCSDQLHHSTEETDIPEAVGIQNFSCFVLSDFLSSQIYIFISTSGNTWQRCDWVLGTIRSNAAVIAVGLDHLT